MLNSYLPLKYTTQQTCPGWHICGVPFKRCHFFVAWEGGSGGCSELWAVRPAKWPPGQSETGLWKPATTQKLFSREKKTKARDTAPEIVDCCDWLLSQELSSHSNYIKELINQICCSQFYPPPECVCVCTCTRLLMLPYTYTATV